MKPHLEQLESRDAPSASPVGQQGNWNVVEITVPPAQGGTFNMQLYLAENFFRSQWGLGFAYQPHTVYEFAWGPSLMTAENGHPLVYRVVAPVLGGEVPMVVCPTFAVANLGGLSWEETCLTEGWWSQDPPGIANRSLVPPGPQYGQGMSPPDVLLADVLLMQNDPLWFW